MGRPPIGDRAMTTAERQRRYIERQVARAAAASRHPPDAGPTLAQLYRYPLSIAPWARRRYGDQATLAVIEALRRALNDPTIKPEFNPLRDE